MYRYNKWFDSYYMIDTPGRVKIGMSGRQYESEKGIHEYEGIQRLLDQINKWYLGHRVMVAEA